MGAARQIFRNARTAPERGERKRRRKRRRKGGSAPLGAPFFFYPLGVRGPAEWPAAKVKPEIPIHATRRQHLPPEIRRGAVPGITGTTAAAQRAGKRRRRHAQRDTIAAGAPRPAQLQAAPPRAARICGGGVTRSVAGGKAGGSAAAERRSPRRVAARAFKRTRTRAKEPAHGRGNKCARTCARPFLDTWQDLK